MVLILRYSSRSYTESDMVKDFTAGPLAKEMFVFSLPLMASNLLQVLFNMSDLAVVGRFSGSTALGAVGSTSILVTLFTGFLIGISSGVNVLAAFYTGAKRQHDLDFTVHSAGILCLFAGVILGFTGILFSRPVLLLLGTKPELLDGALRYFRIYMFGMPALGIYNFCNGALSAEGDTRRPLFFMMFAGILNVALNLFFVLVVGLAESGVAIASVLSQYTAAGMALIFLFRKKEGVRLGQKNIRFDIYKTTRMLKIGIPAGIQYGIFGFANLFIQAGVNSFDASVVSGNAAAANADPLVYDVMAAFYTAGACFIGQNHGAGKKDRIRRSLFLSMGYAFCTALLFGFFLFFEGGLFLSLFTKEASVKSAGLERLQIMAFSYCISAFMDSLIAASRGLGKTVMPTIFVIFGSCIFRIVWVYTVFARFRTLTALYLLYPISWTLTAIAEAVYFIRIFRQEFPSGPAGKSRIPDIRRD